VNKRDGSSAFLSLLAMKMAKVRTGEINCGIYAKRPK
jgi:hypothetical protein